MQCRFCTNFSRSDGSDDAGRKRQRTLCIKVFKVNAKVAQFKGHLQEQHSPQWRVYEGLLQKNPSEADINAFFHNKATMFRFVERGRAIKYPNIDEKIVNDIFGAIYLQARNDDEEFGFEESRERFLRCFVLQDATEEEAEDSTVGGYTVQIKNDTQFKAVQDGLKVGLTFRQLATFLTSLKDRLAVPTLGTLTPQTVSEYARIMAAINLQRISTLMRQTWAFSIGLDMSTHQKMGYLDLRLRVYSARMPEPDMQNVHVLAVPMPESHTAEAIFTKATAILDALCADWRHRIIGVATDGDATMTGAYNGVAAQFSQAAQYSGFVRIWCAAHQLDLIVGRAYDSLHVLTDTMQNKTFPELLMRLSSVLRRKQKWSVDHGEAPQLSTRWNAMHVVSKWFVEKAFVIKEYLPTTPQADAMPPFAWWVYLFMVKKYAAKVWGAFEALQNNQLLLSQQQLRLLKLRDELLSLVNGIGPGRPYSDAEKIDMNSNPDNWVHKFSRDGLEFAVSVEEVAKYRERELTTFMNDWQRELNLDSGEDWFEQDKMFATMFATTCVAIHDLRAENQADDYLPPSVLPHELMKLTNHCFKDNLAKQKDRLLHQFGPRHIDDIELQFRELKDHMDCNIEVKNEVERNARDGCNFRQCWQVFDEKYPTLREYCAGLATVFPGTTQLESDFSLLKGAKTSHRKRLLDLSLEGCMHSKQFSHLERVTVEYGGVL